MKVKDLEKIYLLCMVHSSITDHIDRDGAKCCNSNLPHPMLMKLSGHTNSLLSCVVFEKKVEIPLRTSGNLG